MSTSNNTVPQPPQAMPVQPNQTNELPNPATLQSGSNFAVTNMVDKLQQSNLLTPEQLEQVKLEVIQTGKSIEDVVIEKGLVNARKIYEIKSEIYNVPYVDVTTLRIPVEALNKFDQATARRNMAVAYEETPESVKVAMTDPLDIQKVKFLSTMIGKKIEPVFSDPDSINQVIDTRYGAQISSEVDEALEDVADVVNITGTLTETQDLQADITSAPVSRIVNMILEYAVKYKASDVHIEPREGKIAVRYRVSGVLSEKLTLPKKLGSAVVSRIKILSNLKIDEHRVPQDGRFQIKSGESYIDLRVSIMPSVYGEKVVMRLLEKGGDVLLLEDTGMRGRNLNTYKKSLEKTQGIILVTGPTGSGKTVTLASSLHILNRPEVNIMTLEDPVEIRINGVTQVQVNADVGLTFAKGLRAFLRQDPDIIMVGEIRDKETAELAIQASLTGHLVLATLHTNSAAGALPRLNDMGIEPFLLTSTINVIGAQRLTRKICDQCKASYVATEDEIGKLRAQLGTLSGFDFEEFLKKNNGKIHLFKGEGCPQCGDSGYKGRIGIFEVFELSEEISSMTINRDGAKNIQKQAVAEGMMTMAQDGFLKVLEGITTIEEVLRVIN